MTDMKACPALFIVLHLLLSSCNKEYKATEIKTLKVIYEHELKENQELISAIQRNVESAGNRSADLKLLEKERELETNRAKVIPGSQQEEEINITNFKSYTQYLLNKVKAQKLYNPVLIEAHERAIFFIDSYKNTKNRTAKYHALLNISQLEEAVLENLAIYIGGQYIVCYFGNTYFKMYGPDSSKVNQEVNLIMAPALLDTGHDLETAVFDSAKVLFLGKPLNNITFKTTNGAAYITFTPNAPGKYTFTCIATSVNKYLNTHATGKFTWPLIVTE